MREIVVMGVSFIIGMVEQYAPLVGRFLRANQERIVDIIMRKFGLQLATGGLTLAQIDMEDAVRDAIAEIGVPPAV